jgi:nitrate reductase NapAB chaperone NapD
MPIFSYLATPKDGAREALCADLSALAHCQIIPADNHEVIVLVTDTPNETTEETLQESLKNLQSLQSLDLAFGYSESYNESNDEN